MDELQSIISNSAILAGMGICGTALKFIIIIKKQLFLELIQANVIRYYLKMNKIDIDITYYVFLFVPLYNGERRNNYIEAYK